MAGDLAVVAAHAWMSAGVDSARAGTGTGDDDAMEQMLSPEEVLRIQDEYFADHKRCWDAGYPTVEHRVPTLSRSQC